MAEETDRSAPTAGPGPRPAATAGRWHGWVVAARRYRSPALALAAAIALGAWFGPRLLLGPEVPVAAVVKRDFVKSVVASGRVEAPHRVTIGAQIVGVAARVPVVEGQLVEAGQTLIELERSEALAAMASADVAVAQAQARLRQLVEVQAPVAAQSVRQAQVNLDNARRQLARQADLFRQGFIGQAALDNARRDVELSEAQLRAAESQWRGSEANGSDHAVADAALAQARASAQGARSRLGYTTLVAPVAGTLIDRQVEPGDVVQPGKALMVLSPAGTTQVVVQIDEKNLPLLVVGQSAAVSADAYPDRRFAAKVAYINPGVDAQRGSVEVKLDVAEPPEYLRQDMTVSVDVAVASQAGALLVPTDAVHDADSARPWVLKVVEGRARRQEVRLGLRGTGTSEVAAGLAAGELVVAGGPPELAAGAHVRPRIAAARP